jgi:hypothetical protein
MDVSHILVGVLTAIAFAWLVWAENRSRRNSAAKAENRVETASEESNPLPSEPHSGSGKKRSANIGSGQISRSLSR